MLRLQEPIIIVLLSSRCLWVNKVGMRLLCHLEALGNRNAIQLPHFIVSREATVCYKYRCYRGLRFFARLKQAFSLSL